jgi:hypothetical protein
MGFKIGDRVILKTLPAFVGKLPEESQSIFKFCVGRVYRIVEIDCQGLFVLDVSGDIDKRFGGFANDIRVEKEYLEIVDLTYYYNS